MPLREYRCQDCETHTENLELKESDKLLLCPKCGSDNLERVVTGYGGYSGNFGGGSTTPKGSGSFRGRK